MHRLLLLSCLMCSLVGCSLEKRLEQSSARIEEQYATIKDWQDLPLRVISWQQAMAMIATSNLEVRQSEMSVANAQRAERSVYTDMIPRVSYYGIFNNSLDELASGAINPADMSSAVNVSFSLPTMTQVPYRVYAAQASLFAAEKALEGTKREVSVKLYQLIRTKELNDQLQALEQSRHFLAKQTPIDAEKMRMADDTHWSSIASILGNNEARWQILPETLPRVHWADYCKKLKKLDPLVVCSMAMQIEQAKLQQYSVMLNYLPTLNMNLSSPSLFSSSGGTYSGTFLSSEDTILNLSLSYTLDTDLRYWDNYKSNKENFEKVCRQVESSMIDRRSKLKTLMNSVEEYQVWRNYMEKRIKYEKSSPLSTTSSYLLQQENLLNMQKELLQQEKTAVESEVALAMEYGLPQAK